MEHVGQTVTLAGFLENVREVSQNLAFAVLRDFYGTTQVVIENEAMMAAVKPLNKESTIQVTGVVRERDSKNPKLPTGDIEVVPSEIKVLGRCRHNELPFPINRSREDDESARLPRGRPRLPGAQPQAPRQVLRPAPGPPAVQAAAHGLRL